MPRSKKITLQTIADRVGVSRNAVSLVLRDQGRFSDETRHKIKHLADNLGYVPNFAARSLTLNRSGLIGVFLHSLCDHVRLDYVKYLLDSLHNEQYRPILGLDEHHCGPWHESSWIHTFEQINVDAIVLVGEHITETPPSLKRIPIISVGISPLSSLSYDCVSLDRHDAGRMAVQHLIDKGHQRIISVSPKHAFNDGVIDTLKAYPEMSWKYIDISDSYAPPLIHPDPSAIADRIISSTLRPTAAVFLESLFAVQITKELLSRGVSIPGDLAVIAYDCLPNIDMCEVPLTLIEQPVREITAAAKELVFRRLASPNAEYQQIILAHQLVERASTAGSRNIK